MTRRPAGPDWQERVTASADGTPIAYRTLGRGPGLVVVGGALRAAADYADLAGALARDCTVHVVDRRGRGGSGPQGPGYDLDREVDDLLAVQAGTGARWAFGHSYGGLVVLEAARLRAAWDRVVVYEPGVPAAPVPTAWMAPYRERLAAGDPHGAFAHFVRGSGGAPAVVARMPHWYLRTVMRLGLRGDAWRRLRPLLAANLAEHEQVAARYGHLPDYRAVGAPTLVLHGGRSPAAAVAELTALQQVLPDGTLVALPGLDHFGPEGRTAAVVARRTLDFLLSRTG